jgi:hypothetical protein
VCWIRDEQSVVRDADGHPLEIVGSLLDVTEQKRTEERAERLQELTAGLAGALTPSRSPRAPCCRRWRCWRPRASR